jgi:hypothetical protein
MNDKMHLYPRQNEHHTSDRRRSNASVISVPPHGRLKGTVSKSSQRICKETVSLRPESTCTTAQLKSIKSLTTQRTRRTRHGVVAENSHRGGLHPEHPANTAVEVPDAQRNALFEKAGQGRCNKKTVESDDQSARAHKEPVDVAEFETKNHAKTQGRDRKWPASRDSFGKRYGKRAKRSCCSGPPRSNMMRERPWRAANRDCVTGTHQCAPGSGQLMVSSVQLMRFSSASALSASDTRDPDGEGGGEVKEADERKRPQVVVTYAPAGVLPFPARPSDDQRQGAQ